MNQWLAAETEFLAERTGIDRGLLDLRPEEIDIILDVASLAANESGERTNAPLFCYLLGVVRGHGTPLEEIAELVRFTS
jgi:hypothetical protein